MAICSYVLYPSKGREDALKERVSSWKFTTQLYPAEDQSVYILVTDTPDEQSEKTIKDHLANCAEIECFTLTYANNEQ